jgi:hypothetical protein
MSRERRDQDRAGYTVILGDRGRLRRMSRARMVIVQIDRELLAQSFIVSCGIFKQPLLKMAWKIGPKRQRRSSHDMFKT